MSGINGMSPEFSTSTPSEVKQPKGVNPDLYNEGTSQTQGSEQPTSVFHQLDSNTNQTIEFGEAKNSIFAQMNAGTQTEVINIKSGQYSFNSLFTKNAESSFQEINYSATKEGVSQVDTQITKQVQNLNQKISGMYEYFMQRREQEAEQTKETKDGVTYFKDATGKTFRTEEADSKTNNAYNENGQLVSTQTVDNAGNVTFSSKNTYNNNGQRTSRTYTSNGETLTSKYTYNQNGTLASEIVTNSDGKVIEETKFDKNGHEISYNATIDSDTSTTTINQTFDKGKLKTNQKGITLNDGSATGTYTEEYRNNGNLKRSSSNVEIKNLDTFNATYGTSDNPATLNTNFSRVSEFRRGGELKYETTSTFGTDGSSDTTKTKFRGDGHTRKWTQSGVRNPDSNITAFKENFDIDNQIKSGSVTSRDNNGKKLDKNKLLVFDNNKNKVPQGYTAVKGYQNHYSNAKGEIFTFVEGDNGKPKAVRDHTSMARMHEARLKRELEKSEKA